MRLYELPTDLYRKGAGFFCSRCRGFEEGAPGESGDATSRVRVSSASGGSLREVLERYPILGKTLAFCPSLLRHWGQTSSHTPLAVTSPTASQSSGTAKSARGFVLPHRPQKRSLSCGCSNSSQDKGE